MQYPYDFCRLTSRTFPWDSPLFFWLELQSAQITTVDFSIFCFESKCRMWKLSFSVRWSFPGTSAGMWHLFLISDISTNTKLMDWESSEQLYHALRALLINEWGPRAETLWPTWFVIYAGMKRSHPSKESMLVSNDYWTDLNNSFLRVSWSHIPKSFVVAHIH